jgi:hypothetical protein
MVSHVQLALLAAYLAYTSTLMMEAECFSVNVGKLRPDYTAYR